MTVEIPKPAGPSEEAVEMATNAAAFCAELPKITNPDEAKELSEWLSEVSELAKQIEKARKDEKDPFLKAGRAVDKVYKGTLQVVDECKATIKGALSAWNKKQRMEAEKRSRELLEEQKKLAEEGEGHTTPAFEAEDTTPTFKAKSRKKLVITVDDISKVPPEFLLVNEPKIRAAHKGGMTDIPGITFTEEEIIVS